MSEEVYRLVCWAMVVCFFAAIGALALLSRKRYRELAEMKAAAEQLKPALDAPGIDEDWARHPDAGPEGVAQTTRDNGA